MLSLDLWSTHCDVVDHAERVIKQPSTWQVGSANDNQRKTARKGCVKGRTNMFHSQSEHARQHHAASWQEKWRMESCK